MDLIDEQLQVAGGPFFLGPELSLVDITFVPMVERAAASLAYYKGCVVRGAGRWPAVDAWFDALEARSTYMGTKWAAGCRCGAAAAAAGAAAAGLRSNVGSALGQLQGCCWQRGAGAAVAGRALGSPTAAAAAAAQLGHAPPPTPHPPPPRPPTPRPGPAARANPGAGSAPPPPHCWRRSDYYSHCHDLPPQLGNCAMVAEGVPVAAQIDGGAWQLPLAPLSATSLPEPYSLGGRLGCRGAEAWGRCLRLPPTLALPGCRAAAPAMLAGQGAQPGCWLQGKRVVELLDRTRPPRAAQCRPCRQHILCLGAWRHEFLHCAGSAPPRLEALRTAPHRTAPHRTVGPCLQRARHPLQATTRRWTPWRRPPSCCGTTRRWSGSP
jgi:hypothetical protein